MKNKCPLPHLVVLYVWYVWLCDTNSQQALTHVTHITQKSGLILLCVTHDNTKMCYMCDMCDCVMELHTSSVTLNPEVWILSIYFFHQNVLHTSFHNSMGPLFSFSISISQKNNSKKWLIFEWYVFSHLIQIFVIIVH